MPETRVRIALVGAGRRGQAHFATVRELSDLYELVAVCDFDEARASGMAQECGGQAFTDLRELLSIDRLDAVLIATPPENHHLVAKAAAERGLHMLIETPLALTRAMMDVIGEAADRSGVQVEVGGNYGLRPAERLNRLAIEAGLIGRPVHASVFNASANHDTCYHTVSLLRSYLADDEVEEVEAVARRHDLGPGTPSSETWTDAVLRFSSGVTASVGYVSTWTSALRWGRPRIASVEGTAGYLVTSDAANRLHRLEGSAQRDYGVESETRSDDGTDALLGICYGCAPSVRVENPFAGRVRADAAPDTVADGLARAAELTSLHAAITQGILPEYGITAARRSQEIGIAIAESARLGKPLSTRLGAETGWERERNAV